ncbi:MULTISPECIES: SMP-30/gluconolactonase/LRE family protein [unclassified Schlesneria]|uniref:SMP-30/gluconolactonase/LRE family protein n=1 Tax=Schlesneria TaxID=656899 RepID=UPI0035A12E98
MSIVTESGAERGSTYSRRTFITTSLAMLATVTTRSGDSSRLSAEDRPKSELPPPRFLLEWGSHGKEDGQFDACVGIAISSDDIVYTAEFRNQRIQKFTTEGKFLGGFAVQPHAGGLTVDADGNVYVAHWNSNKIAVYSPEGMLLREWGTRGSGDGEFRLPGSISLGPDQRLYVPDQGNSRVQVFTLEGKFVGKWGSLGSEPGQFGGSQSAGGRFAGPQFVAFDRAGNVYTTDAALDRIQKFTPSGKLLAYWGDESVEPGGFGPPPRNKDGTPGMGGPISICVDARDRVWVSSTNNRVQQFANDGKYLRGVGGEGAHPGQFYLPHGIALDKNSNLYVTDTMNGRIQKFATDDKL